MNKRKYPYLATLDYGPQKDVAGNIELSANLKTSVVFHLLIVIFILIKGMIFPSNPVPYMPTLRVDIVGLPDILKKDLEKQEAPAEPKTAEKAPSNTKDATTQTDTQEDDEMALANKTLKTTQKERKQKLKSAIERLKAINKIKSELNQNKQVLIKGNQISPGTSLTGAAKEGTQINYPDVALEHLRKNWELPVWLARQNLSARVLVYINAQGRLQGFKFQKPSGNPLFDEYVRTAIQSSDPFPAPPPETRRSVLIDDILFGFPL